MYINSSQLTDRLNELRKKVESSSSEDLPKVTEEVLALAHDSILSLAKTEQDLKKLTYL